MTRGWEIPELSVGVVGKIIELYTTFQDTGVYSNFSEKMSYDPYK